jgi:hypothetical protein
MYLCWLSRETYCSAAVMRYLNCPAKSCYCTPLICDFEPKSTANRSTHWQRLAPSPHHTTVNVERHRRVPAAATINWRPSARSAAIPQLPQPPCCWEKTSLAVERMSSFDQSRSNITDRASNPKPNFVVAAVSLVPVSGARAQRSRTVPP